MGGQPERWTFDGFLSEVENLNRRGDRSFAFILGAGASVDSKIPAGGTLARQWLEQLHQRLCHDNSALEQWASAETLGIPGFDMERAADFYPQLFYRRFKSDPDSGYHFLEQVMDRAEPSLGYALLAEILHETQHKVVITTNFDNLIATALSHNGQQHPLVIGHESLTGFARAQARRPVVAKIHRDLLLAPINDPGGVDTLSQEWQDALKVLLQGRTPIVIGYGGNDGSLMGFLKKLDKGVIAGHPFWCVMKGSTPNQLVCDALNHLNGVIVEIGSFDEVMMSLCGALLPDFKIGTIPERLESLGKKRAQAHQDQLSALEKRAATSGTPSPSAAAANKSLKQAVKRDKSWRKWLMQAQAEPDMEKRSEIFRQGIEETKSPELYYEFGRHLEKQGDAAAAEQQYILALERNPRSVMALNDLGNLYHTDLKKPHISLECYRKALEIDNNNLITLNNMACLLATELGRASESETLLMRAIEIEPNHVISWLNLGHNYMDKLELPHKAEKAYLTATEFDNKNPSAWNSLGVLYLDHFGRVEDAERSFLRAIHLQPQEGFYLANLARLHSLQKRYNKAQSLFQQVLNLKDTTLPHPHYVHAAHMQAALLLEKTAKAEKALARLCTSPEAAHLLTEQCWENYDLGVAIEFADLMEASPHESRLQPFITALHAATGDKDALKRLEGVELERAKLVQEAIWLHSHSAGNYRWEV